MALVLFLKVVWSFEDLSQFLFRSTFHCDDDIHHKFPDFLAEEKLHLLPNYDSSTAELVEQL